MKKLQEERESQPLLNRKVKKGEENEKKNEKRRMWLPDGVEVKCTLGWIQKTQVRKLTEFHGIR
jgi:hypothetical protein